MKGITQGWENGVRRRLEDEDEWVEGRRGGTGDSGGFGEHTILAACIRAQHLLEIPSGLWSDRPQGNFVSTLFVILPDGGIERQWSDKLGLETGPRTTQSLLINLRRLVANRIHIARVRRRPPTESHIL